MRIDLKKAAEILSENDDFYILCHANPDGDTLGSGFGLCHVLRKLGKRAEVFCSDEISPKMMFLSENLPKQEFEYKTLVTVDVADSKLLGKYQELYGSDVLLSIDHHSSNKDFARYSYVDSSAAANCEIIFELCGLLNADIDKDIAKCLYTGIATDTGCFRYSNTTAKSHFIAARLMEYSYDFSKLNYQLFDMKSKGRMQLEQEILNAMEMYFDDKVAIITITEKMMEESKGRVDPEDYNGLAGLPKQIEGVVIGVTIKEKDQQYYKLSMRSIDPVNVAEICQKFGGGGHARASGCAITGTIDEVKAKILPELQNALASI